MENYFWLNINVYSMCEMTRNICFAIPRRSKTNMLGTYFALNIIFVLFFVFVKFYGNNKFCKSIIQLPCCPKTLTKLYLLSVEESDCMCFWEHSVRSTVSLSSGYRKELAVAIGNNCHWLWETCRNKLMECISHFFPTGTVTVLNVAVCFVWQG